MHHPQRAHEPAPCSSGGQIKINTTCSAPDDVANIGAGGGGHGGNTGGGDWMTGGEPVKGLGPADEGLGRLGEEPPTAAGGVGSASGEL